MRRTVMCRARHTLFPSDTLSLSAPEHSAVLWYGHVHAAWACMAQASAPHSRRMCHPCLHACLSNCMYRNRLHLL